MHDRFPPEPLATASARLDRGDPPPRDAGLFGTSVSAKEAKLVIQPMPWDRTASFGKGTSEVTDAIVQASHYLDFEDGVYDRPYAAGISLLADPPMAKTWSTVKACPSAVNPVSAEMTDWLRKTTKQWLSQGKIVGILGGEHSVPLGAIQAIGEHVGDFGILHIDAHLDLRQAYEGYKESHASIMYNVMETVSQAKKLVQVGIRDFSRHETAYALAQPERIKTYYDRALFVAKASGIAWRELASMIVAELPMNVYISFDIDGLDPTLCPHTGTPVPGGLSFHEVQLLLDLVVAEGRNIVGFDLCEVAPGQHTSDDWDTNVGARILFRLCSVALFSQGLCGRVATEDFQIEGLKIK